MVDAIARLLTPREADTDVVRAPARSLATVRDAILTLSIAALTFVVFSPALHNGFVEWDDQVNLGDNTDFRGLGPRQLRWMLTSVLMGHYIPVTWFSFGLDYTLWGMNPFGYHLTNLVLHSVNAALVYLVAQRLLRAATGWSGAALRVGAVTGALFFALHPLRAESVAWATERRDVLSALFFLLTVLTHLAAVDVAGRRRRWLRLASLGCFALALGSKSIVMGLPLVLVVLDVYPLRRLPADWRGWWRTPVRRLWLEKVPYLLLGGVGAAVSYYAVLVNSYVTPLSVYPWPARIGMATYSVAVYFSKTLVPIGLSPLYELPVRVNPLEGAFLLSLVAVVILTVAAAVLARRWPAALAAWLYYLITLGPVTGIVHSGHQIAHDRYSYLSCLSWALLLGAAAGGAVWARQRGLLRPGLARLTGAMAGAWLLGLAVLTWYQVQTWHDTERLWRYAIESTPECSLCHNNLGLWLVNHGYPAQGLEEFQEALALRPDRTHVLGNIGLAVATMGRLSEAIEIYKQVIARGPESVEVRSNLGAALIAQRRANEARAHLEHARRLKPNDYAVLTNLGFALNNLGRPAEAVALHRRALELRPNLPHPRVGLAEAYVSLGRLDLAREQYAILKKSDPRAVAQLDPAFITSW